jgi:HEAT repeat protein
VALHALAILERAGRRDLAATADRLRAHPSPRLRAAALQARTGSAADRELLWTATRDPSEVVRATAWVELAALGDGAPETARALEELGRAGPDARRALARAIAHRPSPRFEGLLLELASADDPGVLVEVARAIGASPGDRLLPALLGLLVPYEVRAAAREAFLAHGDEGLAFLEGALADLGLPHEVRRHVPRTISRFPPERAGPILLARLLDEPDGTVRFKILRGLGRIVAGEPRVALDRGTLRRAVERTLEAAFRLVHWRSVMEEGARRDPRRGTAVHDLLVALLRDKERHAIDRLFRLLALELRGEDVEGIHRGLHNADPKLRASSRELLESLLPSPLRRPVLALVDDAPGPERVARAGASYRAPALGYEELLVELLDAPGNTLRTLAVHHAGELGLAALRDRIERLRRESGAPMLERTAARALAALREAGRGAAHGG